MVDRPRQLVDSRRRASVSFAPPDPVALGPRGRLPTRAPIAVGPGRVVRAMPDRAHAERGAGVSYPIQPGKVQAPALRDETLARTRLLDWLEAKIHSRVIFVIADAGYGKTTLLADFSRRTRHRTIWYRLDEDDRDWVGFLSHLVAAGREHDPDFASRTAAMLRSLEPGGPTRDDVVEAFLAELPSLASEGAALIFDDFHLADEVADVRQIAREIVSRAPERLTVVFASRRQPQVPVSKLRAMGEVAELGIPDLRFSDAELEQLFRETYKRPLEPDVLADLAQRTEGWAASLTLVQAALRERSPSETRSFIRSLSGARDELHDYLAEEVVGDLPQIHQQFLMRTSVLQVVTPELAQVATGLAAVEVQSLVLESERLGLLGRRPNRRSTAQRYHPLVREFLEARLLREVGRAGVDELHVTVARWAESTDWRTAAHHFASAQRWEDLQRVLDNNVETIVASGAFAAALEFARVLPDISKSVTGIVIQSRLANSEGDYEKVAELAEMASALDPGSDVVMANLVQARMVRGRYAEAADLADDLMRIATSPLLRDVGIATKALVNSSIDGDLAESIETCESLAERCHADGLLHFEGVSWLNAALLNLAAGSWERALACAGRAIDALEGNASGPELAAARYAEAAAMAFSGQVDAARQRFFQIRAGLSTTFVDEYLSEHAQMEALLGRAELSRQLLGRLGPGGFALSEIQELAKGVLLIRDGRYDEAAHHLSAIDVEQPNPNPGNKVAVKAFISAAQLLGGHPMAGKAANEAVAAATAQGARGWAL
ncbi:MAG TPA: hypothetical protein VH440_00830, partial [Candidatus Limnocylindrales bacterium]